MEELYRQSRAAINRGEKHYWPSTALDDFHDNIQLKFEDGQAYEQLHQMILRQNKELNLAKERLRNLLKENFNVEEILFQSDSNPRF